MNKDSEATGIREGDGLSVHVIDDDPAVIGLIESMLVGMCTTILKYKSAEDFLRTVNLSEGGCVITDLRLPGKQGTELQAELVKQQSPLAVIVVSGAADISTAVQIMRSGAVTILQKPFTPPELLKAVEEGLSRSQHELRIRKRRVELQSRLDQLTGEEHDVLNFLIKGIPHKVICNELNLSARTVDRRRFSIIHKMQVNNLEELIAELATQFPKR